jgi:DNA-directed RNA polymerase
MRSILTRSGYQSKTWTRIETIQAGEVLLNWALKALPDAFLIKKQNGIYYPAISKDVEEVVLAAVEAAKLRSPVFPPCTEPPEPWSSFECGGYWDERTRLGATFVRKALHKGPRKAVEEANNAGL